MMRPWVSVVLLLVACWCLGALVHGQTFQYSHGWTNGRKRAGSSSAPGALLPPGRLPPPAAASDMDAQPCRVRCLRLLLQGGAVPQLYVPPELWQQVDEEGDNMAARQRGGGARLRHALPPPGSAAAVDSDEDM
ncbi:pro-corazonin-like [Schistocerca nitens]|uniref:pro-corazonin-like n=1 Tax=Schistocerca nitens TaxID=7011 RepID=UPI002119312D|nr:pro-corazonin-like [Schistocerca nitens]